jgi:hypothetical protein
MEKRYAAPAAAAFARVAPWYWHLRKSPATTWHVTLSSSTRRTCTVELCVVAAIAPRRGLRRRRATTSLDSSARRSRRGAEDGRSRRAGASLSSARRTNAERRRRRRALPTPLARRCGASPRALAPVCRGVVAREIPAFFFRLGWEIERRVTGQRAFFSPTDPRSTRVRVLVTVCVYEPRAAYSNTSKNLALDDNWHRSL